MPFVDVVLAEAKKGMLAIMEKIKKEELNKLSYTDFVSLIKEENRPSGGKFTIRKIAQNAFINENSKVFEIGCTNGFSSIEINKLTNCNVIGIDINQNSINNANSRILQNNLDTKKISFEYGNAEELRFEDNIFDLIICGNALSFVSDKSKAIRELKRVLKPNGFISIVPIWYYKQPDADVISKVNKELGFNIKCTYEKDWLPYDKWNLELYYKRDFNFLEISEEKIRTYAENLINNKKHLQIYNEEEKNIIINRWIRTMSIFNQNLKMTKFSIILLRKSLVKEEEELFRVQEV